MQKLYQYKTKDPQGSYSWLHTELFGTVEELKAQHPLDLEPEWREVVIVEAETLYCLNRDSVNLSWLREAFVETKRRLRAS